MLNPLDAETLQARAEFLNDVRRFFRERACLEVETPLLNPTGAVEPFLDSLEVRRPTESAVDRKPAGSASGERAGFLITSPEYNLKILLARTGRDLFQIAHCFRAGEAGGLHSEEFLMLEWYRRGIDEFGLMDECDELLDYLAGRPASRIARPGPARRRTVNQVLNEYAGCPDASRASLLSTCERLGLAGADAEAWRYDELFFAVFLNAVEPQLGREGVDFVYQYPRELAALSRIEGDIARRFEIYWQEAELANGYYELIDRAEQERRFAAENELRARLGKEGMTADAQFLAALADMPESSGIALGLDRLFMVLQGARDLKSTSPFWQ